MKKILGIQKDHNASACLFYDDNLIYYHQEERLSKKKKDSGLPIETLKKILEISKEIDVLLIAGYDNFQAENHSIISIIKKLGFEFSSSFECVPYYKSHHLFHASKSFYTSGYSDALVIVKDGRGSYYNLSNGELAFETTSVFSARYPADFRLIYKRFFTHSSIDENTEVMWDNNFTEHRIFRPGYLKGQPNLDIRNDFDSGFIYEGTSRSLGFDDEGGKMMGLQSYGQADEALPSILNDDLKFNMDIFQFDNFRGHRGFNPYINLSSQQSCANLAFMVQKAFEKIGLKLIKDMLEETNHKNLVLTGGTALNVVANNFYRKSLNEDINIYIDPLCGDEGNCIGICQYYYREKSRSLEIKNSMSIYICGDEPAYNFTLYDHETELENVDEQKVTELLISGNIIALFQGKAEAGPRALGNRSLLFDPRVSNGKDIVNIVKKRESFRPFAASVMLEHAKDWFDLEKIEESPNMMYAVNVKLDKKNRIPAVVHVDDTCRIQTVTEFQNKNLYNLLKRFNDKTGVPMLLNTSFNLAGDPIVETIEDAINSLRKSQVEYLYLPEIQKLIYIKH